jgi:hypothetical protein
MHQIIVSKLTVRVNECCKLHVSPTTSVNVVKGCLTMAHQELGDGEVAELYNANGWQVKLEKRSATACAGYVLQGATLVADFESSGTRYAGSDVAGLSLLGLHFSRRVCMSQNAEAVEALLDCARPGAALVPGAARPPALDFCRQPTRNAFASLYHFNKKAFQQVAAACSRDKEQVHAELVLVAMLAVGIDQAAGALAKRGVRGTWCAHALQRVGDVDRVGDDRLGGAPDPSGLPRLIDIKALSVQAADGRVIRIKSSVADDAVHFHTSVPGLLLAVPRHVPARAAGCSPGDFASDVLGTVQALRAAAAGRLAPEAIEYVRARPCLHGMSPWEVALSLLCNAHGAMD